MQFVEIAGEPDRGSASSRALLPVAAVVVGLLPIGLVAIDWFATSRQGASSYVVSPEVEMFAIGIFYPAWIAAVGWRTGLRWLKWALPFAPTALLVPPFLGGMRTYPSGAVDSGASFVSLGIPLMNLTVAILIATWLASRWLPARFWGQTVLALLGSMVIGLLGVAFLPIGGTAV